MLIPAGSQVMNKYTRRQGVLIKHLSAYICQVLFQGDEEVTEVHSDDLQYLDDTIQNPYSIEQGSYRFIDFVQTKDALSMILRKFDTPFEGLEPGIINQTNESLHLVVKILNKTNSIIEKEIKIRQRSACLFGIQIPNHALQFKLQLQIQFMDEKLNLKPFSLNLNVKLLQNTFIEDSYMESLLCYYPFQLVEVIAGKKLKEIATKLEPSKFDSNTNKKLLAGEHPDEIDLHADSLGLTGISKNQILPAQLNALDQFLQSAYQAQLQEIFIIHGIGEGILKNAVHEFLASCYFVQEYENSFFAKYKFGATRVKFYTSIL